MKVYLFIYLYRNLETAQFITSNSRGINKIINSDKKILNHLYQISQLLYIIVRK